MQTTMMVKASFRKLTALLLLAFCLTGSLHAQQTEDRKIKIGGAPKTQTIECNGDEVIVSGERHNLTIKGYCLYVAVYAGKSSIVMDSVRLISIHGDKNRIRYRKAVSFKTKVSRYGSENRVDERE